MDAVVLERGRDGCLADAVAELLELALDRRSPQLAFSVAMRTISSRIAFMMPGRPTRPLCG
jgi:hypothetical protein